MSACVSVYSAVHVVDSPGASVVCGHAATGGLPVPLKAVSETATAVRSTFPVLVTRNEYVTGAFSTYCAGSVRLEDFTRLIAGASAAVKTTVLLPGSSRPLIGPMFEGPFV